MSGMRTGNWNGFIANLCIVDFSLMVLLSFKENKIKSSFPSWRHNVGRAAVFQLVLIGRVCKWRSPEWLRLAEVIMWLSEAWWEATTPRWTIRAEENSKVKTWNCWICSSELVEGCSWARCSQTLSIWAWSGCVMCGAGGERWGCEKTLGSESNRTDPTACRHERPKHVRRVNMSSGSDGPCGMCSGRAPRFWDPAPPASLACCSAVAYYDGDVITTVIFRFWVCCF